MTWSRSLSATPPSAANERSITAYSSAVRCWFVRTRQVPANVSSRYTPNTTCVLLIEIASSTPASLEDRRDRFAQVYASDGLAEHRRDREHVHVRHLLLFRDRDRIRGDDL